jgi:MoxR-like ATPase
MTHDLWGFMQKQGKNAISVRFSIIKALCRVVLAEPTDAAIHQVKRLIDNYSEAGEEKEAASLRELLEGTSSKTTSFAPSRLVRSRASMPGEDLSPRTPLPVDKETAVPLAQIIFQEQLPDFKPTFDSVVEQGVASLVEEWAHWDSLRAMDIHPSQSCLIFGAPGTGKTKLALWMGAQLGLPLVVARLDGLISSFLGTTSRNIGALFNFANRYRCVLLLDEFDAIAKVRDDPNEVGEIKRVVNTLLQNLDSRRETGITIGVTNHEQLLDAAIWRRFDVQLEIPKPAFETRVAIARRYLAPLPMNEQQLRMISWLSEGLAGAEIESLARSIKKASAIEPETFDFMNVVRKLSTLNSGRVSKSRTAALQLENQDLAAALYKDIDVGLEKSDLAVLFGKDPSTIGRWMKEQNPKSVGASHGR